MLDLWCDGARKGRHDDDPMFGNLEVQGANIGDCRVIAEKKGWYVNLTSSVVLCPECAKVLSDGSRD
jgi:hypothetical protein